MSEQPLGAAKGLRVGEIVAALGGTLRGDGQHQVLRIASIERAGATDIAYLNHSSKREWLSTTQAGCMVMPPDLEAEAQRFQAAILTPDPYLYYARLAQWFAELQAEPEVAGVHASAVVEAGADLAPTAVVGPCAVIERGAVIHDAARIGAGCFVGRNAIIGQGTRLHPRAVVLAGCTLGARCIVHSGAVIGADGFGYARDANGVGVKIPQTGSVRIGNDVEIGANTTIDRGALDDTRIGDGVKIDNLVQIAHNVQIGPHTALAGCVGVSGSARIGAHCFIGGGVGIAGHLEIADHVVIGGMSLVSRSVRQPGHYTGAFPLDTHQNWSENAATLRHLSQLRSRVRQLENKLETQALPDSTKP